MMTNSQDQEAEAWDAFLEGSPRGQFQQSSGWARVKALEGWNADRVFNTEGSPFHGGWQVLWKPTRFGRIGFVNKGPVLREESAVAVGASFQAIATQARRLGLRTVILQPPDASLITAADLSRHGFSDLPVRGVIDVTMIAKVEGSPEELQTRINRRVLRHTRQTAKHGVTVRPGSREDLPLSFDLMSETCRRQRVLPSPASVEPLRAIWDAFQSKVRLEFVTVDGTAVPGKLMIGFGSRLTFWKKGWNGEKRIAHANTVLSVECLRWANAQGYREADFVGCDRDFVLSVLDGRPLTQAQQKSRYLFNLLLGAEPRLLVPGQILFVNPGIRALVNTLLRVPGLRRVFLAVCGGIFAK